MNRFLNWLSEKLMAYCTRKGRVFMITGTAGPEDVYLIRYYVIRSRFFNFFIHQFLRSDRDDLHDHPWNFCTYLVRGAYTENKFNPETGKVEATRRENTKQVYSYRTRVTGVDSRGYEVVEAYDQRYYNHRQKNTFVFRRATDQHQVVVDRDLKLHEKDEAALTLFFSGPTKREWGFVREDENQREWIPWRKYLGLPDNAPGRG